MFMTLKHSNITRACVTVCMELRSCASSLQTHSVSVIACDTLSLILYATVTSSPGRRDQAWDLWCTSDGRYPSLHQSATFNIDTILANGLDGIKFFSMRLKNILMTCVRSCVSLISTLVLCVWSQYCFANVGECGTRRVSYFTAINIEIGISMLNLWM